MLLAETGGRILPSSPKYNVLLNPSISTPLSARSFSHIMVKSTLVLTLNNGVQIPALGFGTFAKEGVEGLTHAAVMTALNTGYRHLDCAW